MSQNLLSAAVVISTLRVETLRCRIHLANKCQHANSCWFCFVWFFMSQSTAIVMSGRSVHLNHIFSWASLIFTVLYRKIVYIFTYDLSMKKVISVKPGTHQKRNLLSRTEVVAQMDCHSHRLTSLPTPRLIDQTAKVGPNQSVSCC